MTTMNGRRQRTESSVKLRDVARIGNQVQDDTPSEITQRAWTVWSTMRSRAFGQIVYADDERTVPGYRFEGKLSTVAWEMLRDTLQSAQGRHGARDAVDDVRLYLRTTGNAVCLSYGSGRPVVWWVRDVWNDVSTGAAVQTRFMRESTEERELSAEESGESRDAAPVASGAPSEETTFKVDPRWELEFMKITTRTNTKASSVPVMLRVVDDVVKRDVAFAGEDVTEALGIGQSQAHTQLRTLQDMELLTAEYVQRTTQVKVTYYSSSGEQRAEMRRLATRARSGEKVGSNDYTTVSVVLAGMTDEWQTTSDLATKLFFGRSRLTSALQELKARGAIDRQRHSNEAQWRLMPPGPKPKFADQPIRPPQASDAAPEPAVAPIPMTTPVSPPPPKAAPPAHAPAHEPAHDARSSSSLDDETEVLAGMLHEIVESRVAAGVQEALQRRTGYAEHLEHELEETNVRLRDVTRERDEARSERDTLREQLKQLRSRLKSMIGEDA